MLTKPPHPKLHQGQKHSKASPKLTPICQTTQTKCHMQKRNGLTTAHTKKCYSHWDLCLPQTLPLVIVSAVVMGVTYCDANFFFFLFFCDFPIQATTIQMHLAWLSNQNQQLTQLNGLTNYDFIVYFYNSIKINKKPKIHKQKMNKIHTTINKQIEIDS